MAQDDGAAKAAATYFEAWQARDFPRLRSVLADDVDFAGVLRSAATATRAARPGNRIRAARRHRR
jgi:ketosteroid isomerase-like protein